MLGAEKMKNLSLPQLLQRRIEICNAIADIKTMRRGSFNEFYYNETRKDGSVARRGPFFNVTVAGDKNKTKSRSVPKRDADRVKAEVENYRKFRELSEEYIDVCENISVLTHNDDEAKKN